MELIELKAYNQQIQSLQTFFYLVLWGSFFSVSQKERIRARRRDANSETPAGLSYRCGMIDRSLKVRFVVVTGYLNY